MGDILQYIQDAIGTETCSKSCSRDGCRVSLEGIPSPRVIADADCSPMDCYFPDRRCDFILFFHNSDGTMVVAPLELKGGSPEPTVVSQQLQAGACAAEQMVPHSCRPACRPVLLHGGRMNKEQLRKLNRAKIRFQGKDLTILTGKCGQPSNLAKALSSNLAKAQRRGRR